MTEEGIAHGKVSTTCVPCSKLINFDLYDFSLQIDIDNDDFNSLKKNMKQIQYPKPLYEDYSVSEKPPIGVALTEFHILLAYTDTIKGISLLNNEVVYEDNYNEAFGKLVNIIKDPMTGKEII